MSEIQPLPPNPKQIPSMPPVMNFATVHPAELKALDDAKSKKANKNEESDSNTKKERSESSSVYDTLQSNSKNILDAINSYSDKVNKINEVINLLSELGLSNNDALNSLNNQKESFETTCDSLLEKSQEMINIIDSFTL